jgi:hypothetical protein
MSAIPILCPLLNILRLKSLAAALVNETAIILSGDIF